MLSLEIIQQEVDLVFPEVGARVHLIPVGGVLFAIMHCRGMQFPIALGFTSEELEIGRQNGHDVNRDIAGVFCQYLDRHLSEIYSRAMRPFSPN